ncbi:MAG TPA: arginine deiminase-related protein [Acidimicrobiales bacterium]|nr:arginine deiminase-related protein [Acidimicrobiales bacterium]
MTLPWGRRFLMCPPEHYGVLYEINPWMHREVAVDLERARDQWEMLAATLRGAGAEIEVLEPRPGLPDLVFCANAGTLNRGCFVPSRFRHAERQGEVPHYVEWFSSHGWEVVSLPDGVSHEGAGDALPMGQGFVSGYRFRSDAAAHLALSRLLGAQFRPLELVDARLYHLDLSLCPLDARAAVVAPDAWDPYGRRMVQALVADPIVLERDEVLAFCANSVVVGTTVVMPSCPPRLGRELEARGFDVAVTPMDEFQKAGGACRCLTLALDVAVGVGAPAAEEPEAASLPPAPPSGPPGGDGPTPSTGGGEAR